MKKLLLVFMLVLSAIGKDSFNLNFGVNFFNSSISGDIKNSTSTTKFSNDLGYGQVDSIYFYVNSRFNIDYVPNINFNYFSFNESQTSNTNGNTYHLIGKDFTGTLNSEIDYQVMDLIVYYDFKKKGKYIHLGKGYKFYPGDIEFDLGVDFKKIDYKLRVKSSTQDEFTEVKSIIPLAYFGFKYYLYYFTLYAHVSTFSTSDVQSSSYQYGVEYEFIENLSLTYSYAYESFEATELEDDIKFISSGSRFGLKYRF